MNFDIFIEDSKIQPIKFSSYELAWPIEDSLTVLDYIFSQNKVILGGDILNSNMIHNYDNWYYNYDSQNTHPFNLKISYEVATNYIKNYIRLNGNTYYVIIVTE